MLEAMLAGAQAQMGGGVSGGLQQPGTAARGTGEGEAGGSGETEGGGRAARAAAAALAVREENARRLSVMQAAASQGMVLEAIRMALEGAERMAGNRGQVNQDQAAAAAAAGSGAGGSGAQEGGSNQPAEEEDDEDGGDHAPCPMQ